jgi:segregation and condensation protein A
VSFQVAGHQTEGYHVQTDLYQGPLDLLLELIEKAELDITQLALAQVTDQYLSYLKNLEYQDAAEVSAFLIIAARLVQIKSSALLPRPTVVEAIREEDSAEALVQQLIQYKRFKELSNVLDTRQQAGLRTFLRISLVPVQFEAKLDLSGITLQDLVQAGREILYKRVQLPALDEVVNMPRVTIREKIYYILDSLRKNKISTFDSMVGSHTRVEIVITFLALLELVKRHIVEARQDGLFDEIEMNPVGELNDEEEIELEFGE